MHEARARKMGDVIGDLNRRRGQIEKMEPRPGNVSVVTAFVPLSGVTAEELADADKKKEDEEVPPTKGKTEKRPSTKTE